MSEPADNDIRDALRARYTPPPPGFHQRIRGSLSAGPRRSRSRTWEWAAAIAVVVLAGSAIATFTLIRSHQSAPAAQPVVTSLTGLIEVIDVDGKGSGWVVTASGQPTPLSAYWTSDGGREWHRALGLGSGSV